MTQRRIVSTDIGRSVTRIPLVDSDDLPEEYDIIGRKRSELPTEIDSDFWNRQSTVRAFSHNPVLGETHVTTNTIMWTETGLSAAERECVILAIARAFDSAYEWHDHVIAGIERADLTEEEVLAISRRETGQLPENRRLLVEYAFEYVAEHGAVGEGIHGSLADHYDESTLVGIVMLAGFYVSLSHEIEALDLELAEPFVGWELENYPLPE